MQFRYATVADVSALATLNQELIRDEGHRNRMTVQELANRMTTWLSGEYQAVVFEDNGHILGYALFRDEVEHVYLRQFYVANEHRRRGVGRKAMDWLRQHAWGPSQRIRLDVLVGNVRAIAFWRAVGFRDYCLTLELESGDSGGPPV